LSNAPAQIEALARELPDPEGAIRFYERVRADHPASARAFERDAGLLSDTLALAAWSPLLATTLEQNPEHLAWVARERTAARVRETEELSDSLARFAMTHTRSGAQAMLAAFRRRELLRVYLHDIRRTTTLVETTEELSNLADSVLRYALDHARQELENLYGSPQCADERGRAGVASVVIIALGKLGSRELNYASDIDLLFLYSDEGETTGAGERGSVTNREFFCKLAERVSRIAGGRAGDEAAYRVDLRLRPHGRDGALAVSLAESLRYYGESAHAWELQALIRARASAGSGALFARFAEAVRPRIYRRDETVARSLAHVRLAKQKIDRFRRGEHQGLNVKLGRGGIREIEFITQALQLAHGGRDPWLHAPHTLISLGRLADRRLITERERSELSDAYTFLRTVEHRVQMEHGLQAHSVAEDPGRRATLARRMHFKGARALEEFDLALRLHTSNVSRAFRRVFGDGEEDSDEAVARRTIAAPAQPSNESKGGATAEAVLTREGELASEETQSRARTQAVESGEPGVEAEAAHALAAAEIFARHVEGGEESDAESLAREMRESAARSLNPRRALSTVSRVAASLEKSGERVALSVAALRKFVRLCGASEFFGEILTSSPALIPSVSTPAATVSARDRRSLMRAAVDAESSFGAELSALRRTWTHLLVEIGARDASGDITRDESNALQTSLAAASINVALLIARRELARRHGRLAAGPRLAVLGLGRLGSEGMDYGSDLDIVLTYDEQVPSPIKGLTCEQAYARLAELLVVALSNLTRDGYLYRVDLRLRPDGKNGALASGSRALVEYLGSRASVWEWLAYVKLRAVAGDLEFGRAVERRARAAIDDAALRAGDEVLRAETRRVRERLERERGGRAGARGTDIKYGPGGMLDVYFAVRYLQLRDRLPDEEGERSTNASLLRLREAGSLGEEDFGALRDGYTLLRELDHRLRLLVGRSTRLPSAQDHPTLRDLARTTGYASAAALAADLDARMAAVRVAYERITALK